MTVIIFILVSWHFKFNRLYSYVDYNIHLDISEGRFICNYWDICWALIFSFVVRSVANKVLQEYQEANMLLAVFSSCGLKDLTLSLLVHGPLLKWKTAANCVCRSEGMHQMVKSCYMAVDLPIKAYCFCLFRLQREYWSVWKTAQSNGAVCQRALGCSYSSLCS